MEENFCEVKKIRRFKISSNFWEDKKIMRLLTNFTEPPKNRLTCQKVLLDEINHRKDGFGMIICYSICVLKREKNM